MQSMERLIFNVIGKMIVAEIQRTGFRQVDCNAPSLTTGS